MTTIGSSLAKAEDGLPLITRNMLAQLSGVDKRLTRAEFDAAIAAERTRIANNSVGIYMPTERFHIINEEGYRTLVVGTGGTDAANAAATHARTVVFGSGKSLVLAADSNVVFSTSGAPSAGTANNGDVALDAAAGNVYLKTAGAWAVALTLATGAGSGGSVRLVYTSSTCTSDADLSEQTALTGTDQRAKLQAILDLALSGPLHVIWDGAYLVGAAAGGVNGLLIRSNTRITALPGCGAVLATQANVPLFRGANSTKVPANIVDQNIILEGGTWHGNGYNQVHHNTTVGGVMLMQFIGIKNLLVRNTRHLYASQFHCHTGNFENVVFENIYIDSVRQYVSNTDGIHFVGPGKNLRVSGVTTYNLGDDSVSVTADDTWNTGQPQGPYLPSYGAISNVEIDRVMVNQGKNGVRLLSAGSRMDRVSIRDVKGDMKGYAVVADAGAQGSANPNIVLALGGGSFGRVSIDDVQSINTQGGFLPCCMSIDAAFEQLSISRIKRSYFESVEFPTILFGQYFRAKQLHLDRHQSLPLSGGTHYENLFKFVSGAQVDNMLVSGCMLDGGALASYPIRVDAGASITRMTLLGNVGSGYSDFVSNGGTIGRLDQPATNNFMIVPSSWVLAAGFTEQAANAVKFTGPIAGSVNWTKKLSADGFGGNLTVSAQMLMASSAGVASFAGAVFARGTGVSLTNGGTSYRLDVSVGSVSNGFRLVKSVSGTETIIGARIGTGVIGETYTLSLTCRDGTQQGVVQRLSDGFYLNSSGTFVTGAQVAFSTTDTAIPAAAGDYGVYGYGTDTSGNEVITYTNFSAVSAPSQIATGWTSEAGYTENSASSLSYAGPFLGARVSYKMAADSFGGNAKVSSRIRFLDTVTTTMEAALFLRATTPAPWGNSRNAYTFVIDQKSGAVRIQKNIGATLTIIGSATPNTANQFPTNNDFDVTLQANGTTLTARIQRVSDGLYLQTNGTWAATAVDCCTATDTAIAAASGLYGVYTYAYNSSAAVSGVQYTNFAIAAAT